MAKFEIHNSSSSVNWVGKKVLGLHTGSINIANGYITITDNNITDGSIQIDMTSIAITDIEDKKNHDDFLAHLRNDDFFAVDAFNMATLVISNAEQLPDNKFKIDGMLTIKNITHPIQFIASIEIFTATLYALGTIAIDRTLYNIRYGSGKFIDNLGDKLIYDEFVLQFKLIANKIN